MNWILASLLMFCSSVVLYTTIRKATLLKIPTEILNFASFGIPLIFYSILFVKDNLISSIQLNHVLFLFMLSIIGSYLPNITSLTGIKYAPNPGYSLIISKSYVVFTVLVALLFFHAPFSMKSMIAIAFIITFSALIVVGKVPKSHSSNPLWFPLTMASFFGWGILSIGTKYAFNLGVGIIPRLFWLSVFVTCFILVEMKVKKLNLLKFFTKENAFLISVIGIASFFFNLFMVQALDSAPNIGYVNAINASSISAVTLVAAAVFKDDFSKSKIVGVIGVTVGLLLLIL